MNILIFAPANAGSRCAGLAHAMAASLAQAGHHASLVQAHDAAAAADPVPCVNLNDEAAVRALAAQADLVVHQVGASENPHARTSAWMQAVPGVLWLCEANVLEAARRYGAYALAIVAPCGTSADALRPLCQGPVLLVDGAGLAAALPALAQAVQGVAPVRAALDDMAATLRRWGADDEMIGTCGLASGFDLFEA